MGGFGIWHSYFHLVSAGQIAGHQRVNEIYLDCNTIWEALRNTKPTPSPDLKVVTSGNVHELFYMQIQIPMLLGP